MRVSESFYLQRWGSGANSESLHAMQSNSYSSVRVEVHTFILGEVRHVWIWGVTQQFLCSKSFDSWITLSKKYAIWLIFKCSGAKKAYKSWNLLDRSCWVTPQIHIWRTSFRLEVSLYSWWCIHKRKYDWSLQFEGDQKERRYMLECNVKTLWEGHKIGKDLLLALKTHLLLLNT